MHWQYFVLIAVGIVGVHGSSNPDDENWDRNKLETECHGPLRRDQRNLESEPQTNSLQNGLPTVSDISPFRADRLTKEECTAYAKVPCGERKYDYCRTDLGWGNTKVFKTYYTLSCGLGGSRVPIAAYAKNVSVVSPNRAVVVELQERNDIMDPVNADVFETIRNQVIELRIKKTVTTTITSKIRDIGNLPNLVSLEVASGLSLIIKKDDFSNVPNVRMITFSSSTIAEMDPYTFTDLPNLLTLALEKYVVIGLLALEGDLNLMNAMQSPSFTKTDVEMIKRLHCDCSFSWLRNFLKKRQYLTDTKKKGEVATIGNFVIPTETWNVWPENLRVDCGKDLDTKNVAVYDTEFSSNTTCYDMVC